MKNLPQRRGRIRKELKPPTRKLEAIPQRPTHPLLEERLPINLPIPAILQLVLIPKVNANEVVLIDVPLPDNTIGLDDVRAFENQSRRGKTNVVAAEHPWGQSGGSDGHFPDAYTLEALERRLLRRKGLESIREIAQDLAGDIPVLLIQLVNGFVELRQEVVGVQKPVAEDCFKLERDAPIHSFQPQLNGVKSGG